MYIRVMKYNPSVHNRRSIRLRDWDYAGKGAYFITICCQNHKHYFGEIVNKKMILNELGNQAYDEWKKLSKRYPWITFDIFQIMPNHMHGIIEINRTNYGSANVPIPTFTTQPVGATLAVAPLHANLHARDADMHANTNANVCNVVDGANIIADCANIIAEGTTARVAPTGNAAHGNAAHDPTTIGRIIGAYKSLVFQNCLEIAHINNLVLGKLWQRNYYEYVIRDQIEYAGIKKYIHDNPALWKKRRLNTIIDIR